MSDIRDFVMAEPLFGNHDHQKGFNGRDWTHCTAEEFLSYAAGDLVTAGLQYQEGDPESIFETWDFVRTTGYGQATEMACRDFCGLNFTKKNLDAINEAIQSHAKGKTGEDIYLDLYKRANVCGVINDAYWEWPSPLSMFTGEEYPDFFRFVLRYDDLQVLADRSQVESLEAKTEQSIQNLDDLSAALDHYAEKASEPGLMAGFKVGLAYSRRLDFEDAPKTAAERIFSSIMKGEDTANLKPLHDFLFHDLIKRAGRMNLPVQIHTGYLAGTWQNPTQGALEPLIPIFIQYQDVRFDIFHAAWPDSELLGTVAKSNPNVYPDLCWAWSMNPVHMERVLDDWLAGVPCNKIFGFGADTGGPHVVPGYARQARIGIANVLERKIERGEYDRSTAEFVAKRIMHENAEEFYGMRIL